MAIEWTPRLAIGVKAIDTQHQELFQRVNQLLAAMESKTGGAEVKRLVDFLGDYVVRHFGDEERLMQRHAYPDYPAQKTAHDAFVADFVKLKAELTRHGASPALAVQLNDKLCGWLIDHVGRADRALGVFLTKKTGPGATPQA